MMKQLGLLLTLVLGLGLLPADATAQTHVEIGPRVGFDVANVEELLVGVDARIGHEDLDIEVQSALDVFLPENGSFTLLSANLLYLVPLDDPRFVPYAGAGAGFSFYDRNGQNQSDAGFNLIGGFRFPSESAFTPFVQTQVTLGEVDLIAISGGLLLRL